MMLRLILTTTETTKFIKCVSRMPFTDRTETTLLAEYLPTKDLVRPKSHTKIYWRVEGVLEFKYVKKMIKK